MTRDFGLDNMAMKTVIAHIAGLPAGKAPKLFGYVPDTQGNLRLSTESKFAPRIHLALQYLVRTYFRIDKVIAIRLGKSVSYVPRGNTPTAARSFIMRAMRTLASTITNQQAQR